MYARIGFLLIQVLSFVSAFNTPVITPNIGGFKSLLTAGGGLICNGNLEDLCKVMEKSVNVNFTKDEID